MAAVIGMAIHMALPALALTPDMQMMGRGFSEACTRHAEKGKSGRLLRRPQQDYPAATVVDFLTAVLTVVEVEQIAGVLVKDDMAATGTPLFGASAKTGERSFVFALSADDGAGYTNAYMLNDHQNIDLALVLKNGRNALLTLQKDDEARIKFREVLESWAE